MRGRRLAASLFAIAFVIGGFVVARPYLHGLAFVLRAADIDGRIRRVADLDAVPVHTRELAIPTARGPMRARVYEPEGSH
ncbi:MAG: hypothetical protein JF610_09480, partial [Acidobacteria bacterium]|nr:hypothetical protein [Acidobacteriota bacterium]